MSKIILDNFNYNINDIYNDKNYKSCNACDGSGFIKNYLYEIYKINLGVKNIDMYILEKNYNRTPYSKCIICCQTGKTDYEAVFYYTCCLNKNKSLIK